jgi:predicted PurR-regulated permease PerM
MPRPDYSRIAVLVVLLIVLYFVYRIVEPFLHGLVWAAILATVFYPLFSALSRRLRRPRLASVLSCVVLTVGIVLPAIFLFSMLARQSVGAYKALEVRITPSGPASLEAARNSSSYQWFLAKSKELGMPEPDLRTVATKAIGLVSGFLVSRSASIFSGITDLVVNFLVMLLLFYYLLLRGPDILHQLSQLSPLRPEHEEMIIGKFRAFARAIFWGILATALIHGVAGGLIFLIAGLPSPLLWGAVMALVSLVPVAGTALVWGPLVVYYLLTGSVVKGIILLVVFAGEVGIGDYVIRPIVMKKGTEEVDSLWILLTVIGGVMVFGSLGLFLGPFLFALLLALFDVYKIEFRHELGGYIDNK